MDQTQLLEGEDKNKKKGAIISIIIHILILLIAFLPLLTYPDPPPGQQGVLVNLGLPDMGEGDDNAAPSKQEEAETQEEEIEEEETTPPPPPEKVQPTKAEKKSAPQKELIQSQEEIAALRKKKEEDKQKAEAAAEAERAEEERKDEVRRKLREAKEAKRKADEKKKREAAEAARKKAEADQVKDNIGGLFGSGDGKGNTGTPGNQGDPDGDPNSNVLEGISTGSGKIGGGLGNRGVVSRPKIKDNSQEEGTVVVKVCVDPQGSVTSATYTQRGSSTVNGRLIAIAEKSAKKFKFEKGSLEKQCGTITIEFKLK